MVSAFFRHSNIGFTKENDSSRLITPTLEDPDDVYIYWTLYNFPFNLLRKITVLVKPVSIANTARHIKYVMEMDLWDVEEEREAAQTKNCPDL